MCLTIAGWKTWRKVNAKTNSLIIVVCFIAPVSEEWKERRGSDGRLTMSVTTWT